MGARFMPSRTILLEIRKYLKSEDVKTILLCSKLAVNYYCVTDLLPIYEVNAELGRFLKEQATFIVSDDLKVTASQSIATISNFNAPGVCWSKVDLVIRKK
uniref:Uncharacterized protein n=1 Tax=Lactuca sativa TaxID=4236 RepID=A0A9R1UFI0_LACSA|nr:hypothetical protein LSAT_V11C900469260 [Lactuca sativa]